MTGGQKLRKLIEDAVSDGSDEIRSAHLLQRVAGIYEHQMDSLGMAVNAYRRVTELQPGHRPSLHALERLFTAGEQWNELLDVFMIRLEHADDEEERRRTQFQIAELLEDFLADPEGAIQVYCDVIGDDETYGPALEALARLYDTQEMYPELAEIYEAQLSCAEEDAANAIRVRLGEVRTHRLGEGGSHRTLSGSPGC